MGTPRGRACDDRVASCNRRGRAGETDRLGGRNAAPVRPYTEGYSDEGRSAVFCIVDHEPVRHGLTPRSPAPRARAQASRPPRPARRPAQDDPRRRRAARPDDRDRGRRHRALQGPGEARRLLRAHPARQAVGPERAHGQALEVGLAPSALGGGRGVAVGLTQDEPLALPLRGRHAPPRQVEPCQRSAVPRKVLIATWHVLARQEPFKPCHPSGGLHPASRAGSPAARGISAS